MTERKNRQNQCQSKGKEIRFIEEREKGSYEDVRQIRWHRGLAAIRPMRGE